MGSARAEHHSADHQSFALWEDELRRHARFRTMKSTGRALLEGMILVGGFYCPSLAVETARVQTQRAASRAR